MAIAPIAIEAKAYRFAFTPLESFSHVVLLIESWFALKENFNMHIVNCITATCGRGRIIYPPFE